MFPGPIRSPQHRPATDECPVIYTHLAMRSTGQGVAVVPSTHPPKPSVSPRGLIGRNAWRERRPRFHAGADFRTRDGYNGERIVVIAPTDLPGMRSLSLVGSDQLRRAGVNVDLGNG